MVGPSRGLESAARVFLTLDGFECETQFGVTDDRGVVFAYADLRIKGTNVLGEIDGLVKYRQPWHQRDASEVVIQEKLREDRIRRLGWHVERFVAAEIRQPGHVVGRMRRAVAASRRVG